METDNKQQVIMQSIANVFPDDEKIGDTKWKICFVPPCTSPATIPMYPYMGIEKDLIYYERDAFVEVVSLYTLRPYYVIVEGETKTIAVYVGQKEVKL